MVTVLGTVLPPLLIISVISFFYTAFRDNIVANAVLKGMQAGVAAVIADVVVNLGSNVLKEKNIISALTMIGAFAAIYFFKINVMYIILVCGCIGAIKVYIQAKTTTEGGDIK
jgi:chromate transporter